MKILLLAFTLVAASGAVLLAGAEPSSAPKPPLGIWGWFNGKTVEFKAGGETEASDGMLGRWTGGNATQGMTVRWNEGPTDRMTLSGDGKELRQQEGDRGIIGEWLMPTVSPVTVAIVTLRTTGNPAKPDLSTIPTPTDTRLLGEWRWFNDQTVTFTREGGIRASGGLTGRWTIKAATRQVMVRWESGHQDTLTLSPDSQRLEGSNQAGLAINAERVKFAPSAPDDPEATSSPDQKPEPLGTRRPGTGSP